MSDDSLKVTCPKCSSTLNIAANLRDKKIGCPNCQHKFRLLIRSGSSETGSTVPADREPREHSGRTIAPPPGEASKSAHAGSTRPLNSNSSLSSSQSGSMSNSQDPVHTDWGKEHETQTKQFKKDHAGLSRSQIYRLAKDRYNPLSSRDEILQSTGIFLCIMAMLTAVLPLFNLAFVDFAFAGSIPALLSIGAAMIGILMIVIAQRNNPIMALGLGISTLLIFVVAYVGIYDVFKEDNPFRRKLASAARSLEKIDGETGDSQNANVADSNKDATAERNLKTSESTPIGTKGTGGFRRMRDDPGPISPKDIEVPADFDPDADRFESSNLTKRNNNETIEKTPTSPEALAKQNELAALENRKPFLLNRRMERLTTESFYRGKPSTKDFSEVFDVAGVAGDVAVVGTAYLADKPIIGFDYVVRAGTFIEKLVPAIGQPEFASTISGADQSELRGLICHFHRGQLARVQALFWREEDQTLYHGKWAGRTTPEKEAGYQITSGDRPIHGFVLFTKNEEIVGVGLVVKKKS